MKNPSCRVLSGFRCERNFPPDPLRFSLLLAILAVGVSAIGCAKAKPAFPTAKLQGVVTIDGSPVKTGSLQFMPGPTVKGQPSQAAILDGKYSADQVPIGPVRVLFTITRETGKMIKEYSNTYPEVENLVPEHYRSGLEITVSGDAQMPFELLTQSGTAN